MDAADAYVAGWDARVAKSPKLVDPFPIDETENHRIWLVGWVDAALVRAEVSMGSAMALEFGGRVMAAQDFGDRTPRSEIELAALRWYNGHNLGLYDVEEAKASLLQGGEYRDALLAQIRKGREIHLNGWNMNGPYLARVVRQFQAAHPDWTPMAEAA